MRRMRTRASKASPKPIKMMAPAADPDGLRQAYEWMTVDRGAGLRLALDWYQTNLTSLLFGDPLDADRQRSYDRAVKSKAQGDHTTFDGERQTAWTTALRLFEKTWPARKLPTVMEATQATDMGSAPTRRVSDVRTVIDSLNTAYNGLATFRMTFGNERELDGSEVLVPVAELTAMVPMTPLKLALREAPTVAKILSVVVNEETGERVLDGGRFMIALPGVLDKVADWASHGNLATKAVGKVKAARSTAPRAAKSPGAPRAPRNKALNNATIHLVANVVPPSMRGVKRQIAMLIRNGDTVAQYQAAVAANVPGKHTWDAKTVLEAYVAAGAATVA
jgi:hypothetical protein